MRIEDFDYNLPDELIATHPAFPRDHSRLLVLGKKSGNIEHKHFFDIIDYLDEGDCLILNNSCVIPARLLGSKKNTGGKVEVFLHKRIKDGVWECLLGGKKIEEGLEIEFKIDDKICYLGAVVSKNNYDGTWLLEFNLAGRDFLREIERIGNIPLPPYIERQRRGEDNSRNNDKTDYQTVYADVGQKGSVAAPTAGLHFTPGLLQEIESRGINIEYITLHVGMGTFSPVKVDNIKEHKMHAEWVEIESKTIERILEAKKIGKKVVTVGTTSARAVEAAFGSLRDGSTVEKYEDWVDIFIYPGYIFQAVDAMITNFHLPKSTLLMLVSALATKDYIDKAYQEAVLGKYRFYSYGDAMLII